MQNIVGRKSLHSINCNIMDDSFGNPIGIKFFANQRLKYQRMVIIISIESSLQDNIDEY